MTPRESAFWRRIQAAIKKDYAHLIHAQRIETSTGPGVPDVNICAKGLGEGWLELKYLKEWPVRPGTTVTIGLRPEQRAWLLHRKRTGGRVGVLLGMGEAEVLLFTSEAALKGLDAAGWHREALLGAAQSVWECVDVRGIVVALLK